MKCGEGVFIKDEELMKLMLLVNAGFYVKAVHRPQ